MSDSKDIRGLSLPHLSLPHLFLPHLFLPHLDDATRLALADEARLAAELTAFWSAARASWPDIELGAADFLAFVARRLDPEAGQALSRLRADDLYLLCAYLQGAPGASARFEAHYFTPAGHALRRLRADADELAEIKQLLRYRLLLDRTVDPERRHYMGTGSLSAWLCVSAVREVWHLRRRRGRVDAIDDHSLQDLPARDEDHELAYLKQLYRREFKESFQEALDTLSPRERNILRCNVLKGLNIEEIGVIYRVHRATVARWIASARVTLRDRTREALARRVHVADGELESILRLIESQMDVSLKRRLEQDP
jgi:RNA polymerase sigma-70 factor (ECF subfamily)